MDTQHLGTVIGTIRTGVGVSLLAAPTWAGRIWVGEDAHGHGTKVFARAIGARDVALGAGILAASVSGNPTQVARMVQMGAVADVADMAATLIAWRNLEGRRRWLMPLVAVTAAAAGAAVARQIEEAGHVRVGDVADPGADDKESVESVEVDRDAVSSGTYDIAVPLHAL